MTDSQLPPNTQCGRWIGPELRYCRAVEGLRRYIPGYRCPLHTPAALQGMPEPEPGPGWPIHRQQGQAG